MKILLRRLASQRWSRFILGGGINTAFTYSVYLAMNLIMNYQIAYLMAYVLGIIFAYWFNAVIVFQVPLTWKKFLSYPLIYLVQYSLSALLLGLFVEVFEVNKQLAPLIVTVGIIPVTFMMNKWMLENPHLRETTEKEECLNKIIQ